MTKILDESSGYTQEGGLLSLDDGRTFDVISRLDWRSDFGTDGPFLNLWKTVLS